MNRSTYRSLLAQFLDRSGSILVKAAIVLFVLLVITQILMEVDELRFWLSETYRLEGVLLGQTGNP